MTIDDFEAALPAHKVTLHLVHNEHRSLYQSIGEYTEEDRDRFVSAAEYDRAIATDDLWELQWYPETAIGFHRLFASSLTALMEAAREFTE